MRMIVDEVRELEILLAQPETLRSSSEFERLVSDDFVEFGNSGRVYRKEDVRAMVAAHPPEAPVPIADLRVIELSPDAGLALYSTPQSNRSSVWRREASGLRIVFHQGTNTPSTGENRPPPGRQEVIGIVVEYFRAIEAKDTERVRACLHPDVAQTEYPNQLVKAGASRKLDAMLDGLTRGAKVLSSESYEVEDSLVDGDRVACRVHWRGTLAVEVLGKKPGDVLEARFGVFLRLKDGKVLEQHNFDCFYV
jgi:ketosteroid isomerase-like protein